MSHGGSSVQIVIAGTRNLAKVAELARLLHVVVRVVAPPATVEIMEDEIGASLEEIAAAKARAWSEATAQAGQRELVIATDGGLLVPGLGSGWDPTRTKRFAGPGAASAELAAALLEMARPLTGSQRRIGWREAVAVARDGEIRALFTAESPPGFLADSPPDDELANDSEFWVPALWICPEFGGRRLASLTPKEQATRPDHWTRLGTVLRRYLAERPRRRR